MPYRIRTLLTLPVAAALLLVWLDQSHRGHWSGTAHVRLDFLVLDDATGGPIPGAAIRLDPLGWGIVHEDTMTDRDGRAALILGAPAGGRFTLLRRERHVHYRGWDLRVGADGYEPATPDFGELTSDIQFHAFGATPPPILIRLGRRPEKL
ncbi:MAG TPA: carboxypeptidase-like regulatory domain-containing protein [Isosphaeraceae bacterium]|jgi:hypothetical protein